MASVVQNKVCMYLFVCVCVVLSARGFVCIVVCMYRLSVSYRMVNKVGLSLCQAYYTCGPHQGPYVFICVCGYQMYAKHGAE